MLGISQFGKRNRCARGRIQSTLVGKEISILKKIITPNEDLDDFFERSFGSKKTSESDSQKFFDLLENGDKSITPTVEAKCLDCGLPYTQFPLDLILPRPQWLEIHPDDTGVLCALCILKRAARVPGCTCVHGILEIIPCRSGENLNSRYAETVNPPESSEVKKPATPWE